jgi:selenocysteine lyase/cysteine desulfurase
VVKGRSSFEVARLLADRAVFVSNGDFYATTAIARLGHAEDGVVRAGCACYTTAEEVDRLLEGVREAARGAAVTAGARGAEPPPARR